MGILNGKLGKEELIGGIILGIIVVICTFLFLKINKTEVYYQVIFDSKGGTEVAGQNVLIGNPAKPPSETKKEGYIFEGWYQGDKLFDFKTNIRKDITLTAKWKKEKKEEPVTEKKEEAKKEETPKKETPKTNEKQTVIEQKKSETKTEPTEIKASNITLNPTNITMKVGETRTINATIYPNNTTNKNIIWNASPANSIITISNGIVTAKNPGTATVTAIIDNKIATCSVTVIKNITYNYEMIDTPGSAIGQCNIYIKSSEEVRVSGTIRIDYTSGGSETVNVTPSGILRVKSIISNITIINAG